LVATKVILELNRLVLLKYRSFVHLIVLKQLHYINSYVSC